MAVHRLLSGKNNSKFLSGTVPASRDGFAILPAVDKAIPVAVLWTVGIEKKAVFGDLTCDFA
jgi:hypothetical protein